MLIGVPKEVKNNEFRVALTPAGADALIRDGHDVVVQSGAAEGSGIVDAAYAAVGARVLSTAGEVWAAADLLLKVKEPIASEFAYLRAGQTLFTYLHLANDRALTESLIASGTTAIAYETVQLADRSLPLLAPMSEIAGRLAAIEGAHTLLRTRGGNGSLMGGVAGTSPAKVVIIGGGVAGEHAAANALGTGADVTVIDISIPRLRALQRDLGPALHTRLSTPYDIADALSDADLVIGSVLIPGAAAPKLVTDEMVAAMRPGAVLVDIAIDQGGCFEHSRPTTHEEPTFRVHDAVYYCVANMPGAVPSTSTRALSNATLPYIRRLANLGTEAALAADPAFAAGLNVADGRIVNDAVAMAFAA